MLESLLTGNKHISSRTLVLERWRVSMDWQELLGVNWTTLVNWLSNDIDDSSEGGWADWDLNWSTSVLDWLSSDKTLSGIQSNGTHVVASQMLGNLEDESVLGTLDLKGIENWWELSRELDINDGTNNLRNLSSSSGTTAESSYSHTSKG